MDDDAKALLEAHGAMVLANAMALVGKVSHLSVATIRTLGLSTDTSVSLSECTTSAELAKVRKEIIKALVAADTKALLKLGKGRPTGTDKTEAATLVVARMLTGVSTESKVAPLSPGLGNQGGGTLHVVSEKAEDLADTMQGYETSELEKQLTKARKMFNARWRSHHIAKFAQVKKIAHFVFKEGSFPEPARMPLSKMQRTANDGAFTLFCRLIRTVCVVAAGEEIKEGQRDEGAGDVPKYKPQWANINVVEDLISELDEEREQVTEAQMLGVVNTIYTSLYKSTARGNSTLSLACELLLAGKVSEFVAAQKAAGKPHKTPTQTQAKAGDKRDKGGKATTPTKTAKATPKKTTDKPKFEDKADAEKTPNGLPRMKGGNPDGKPCNDFFQRGKCPYGTCSFSHVAE